MDKTKNKKLIQYPSSRILSVQKRRELLIKEIERLLDEDKDSPIESLKRLSKALELCVTLLKTTPEGFMKRKPKRRKKDERKL